MAGNIQYELHQMPLCFEEAKPGEELPWHPDESPKPSEPALVVRATDGMVWARVNPDGGLLEHVERAEDADLAFRVLHRRISSDLALLTRHDNVLVNGLPALRFSLLTTKDSIRLAPGRLLYVTERIKPYVGPATEELVGKKCPFCRMPITAETHVVTCRCGAVYHHETPASHPDLSDEDRLDCFGKLQNCLACGNRLTMNEYLLWEPERS